MSAWHPRWNVGCCGEGPRTSRTLEKLLNPTNEELLASGAVSIAPVLPTCHSHHVLPVCVWVHNRLRYMRPALWRDLGLTAG